MRDSKCGGLLKYILFLSTRIQRYMLLFLLKNPLAGNHSWQCLRSIIFNPKTGDVYKTNVQLCKEILLNTHQEQSTKLTNKLSNRTHVANR